MNATVLSVSVVGLNLQAPNVTLPANHLAAMLLLGCFIEYLDHAIDRIFNGRVGLRGAEVMCAGVAEICLHPARVHDEGVEPGVLAVDADCEPVHRRLGGAVRRIRDGGLVTIYNQG